MGARANQLAILQARPITALHGHNPIAGEWNDSLCGDYLWSNGNFGEAAPDVMTPCTWSLLQLFMADAMATWSVAPYNAYGNIGGRPYMNLSMSAALAAAFGVTLTNFRKLAEDVFGHLPEELEIPVPRLHALASAAPLAAGRLACPAPYAPQPAGNCRPSQQRRPGGARSYASGSRSRPTSRYCCSYGRRRSRPLFRQVRAHAGRRPPSWRGLAYRSARAARASRKLVGETDANAFSRDFTAAWRPTGQPRTTSWDWHNWRAARSTGRLHAAIWPSQPAHV